MNRRDFLAATALSAIVPTFGLASPAKTLTAMAAKVQLAPKDFPPTDIWGFDGSVPGPEIRVKQGARVERSFINQLPQASAVHWHGIRIDNAMDGVPGMTQTAVEPEQTFDYSFIAPDAGTYWYHSHNRSWEQVARGLYGPLIIDEVDLPDVDQDITLMIDDWRLDKSGAISNDFGAMHDNSHGGRLGNFATVNGKADSIYPVKTHERLRLRLINAANARIFQLGIKGLNGSIVALDGMPLETPQPIDLITLAPAQRADLIVDVVAETGGEAVLYMQERDTSYALTDFEVTSQAAGAKRESITSLPPNPVAVVNNLSNALTVPIVMEGGAMGGLQTATYQGQELDMRALVNAGQVWALNGVAGLTDEPLFRVSRGEAVRLSFTNKTAFPHGMHLHGHHFHELGPQNQMGALRDTTLINPRETRDVAFIADNPGKWLIHCHMLGHQATGMKTWIEVK